jgi:hypothetical protein
MTLDLEAGSIVLFSLKNKAISLWQRDRHLGAASMSAITSHPGTAHLPSGARL